MSSKIHNLGYLATMMAMASSVYSHPEKLFDDEVYKKKTVAPITPKTSIKERFSEELKSKGLKEFEINGKCIIAHNEREAQKRYNKRYK